MKSFLALFLIAAIGVFTIGCDTKKGTTENTTKTTVTETKDGKVTGKSETTTTDTLKTVPPATPGADAKTTEKSSATTETTK